ncbi:MAG: hypothetical protein CMN32_12070 [Saprospirales bacterium]|nr:hypothetical protein [Saprospirales bacterium]
MQQYMAANVSAHQTVISRLRPAVLVWSIAIDLSVRKSRLCRSRPCAGKWYVQMAIAILSSQENQATCPLPGIPGFRKLISS